jgi:hypothetical protein
MAGVRWFTCKPGQVTFAFTNQEQSRRRLLTLLAEDSPQSAITEAAAAFLPVTRCSLHCTGDRFIL